MSDQAEANQSVPGEINTANNLVGTEGQSDKVENKLSDLRQPSEPQKTVAQLKQELTNLCFDAGNLGYAIEVTKAQLRQCNERIHATKQRYEAAVQEESKKKSSSVQPSTPLTVEPTTSTSSDKA